VLATSVLVYTGILDFRYVIFVPRWIFKLPPDLWRLVTPFLITGPQFSILLDTYFVYTYASALETESARFAHPGDFVTYLCFVCLTIVILNTGLFGGVIFTPALILALAYTFSQDQPRRQVTFFVITLPIKWLPYTMLLVTFIMGGPHAAKQQVSGLLAAHLYDFLTRLYPTFGGGPTFIRTPQFVQRWFSRNTPTMTSRTYGTSFVARTNNRQQTSAPNRGYTSGFTAGVSNLWGSRGSGRRLGGD